MESVMHVSTLNSGESFVGKRYKFEKQLMVAEKNHIKRKRMVTSGESD